MCGPLVCAVLGPGCHMRSWQLWQYNLSRIITYSFIGLGLGAVSQLLGSLSQTFAFGLSFFLGGLLILLACKPLLKKLKVELPGFTANKHVMVKLSALLRKLPNGFQAAGLGLLTAFLPCGTLTPAFAMSAASGGSVNGGMLMLGFGLGTLPVMLIAPALSRGALKKIPHHYAEICASIFLFLAGLITIFRVFH